MAAAPAAAAVARPAAGALPPALLRSLGQELAQRLPRLLFAAIDDFPLASGLEVEGSPGAGAQRGADQEAQPQQQQQQPRPQPRRVVAIAVRSVAASERLDEILRAEVVELAKGAHRPAKQMMARRVELDVPDAADGGVRLIVNWHESVDYARLMLRGVPSCVEALARGDQASVLHESEEWADLRARVVAATGSVAHPALCKLYLKACLGASQSVVRRLQVAGKAELPEASALLLGELCSRVAGGCSPELQAQVAALRAGSASGLAEPWRELLGQLTTGVDAAQDVGASLETAVEAWCAAVRAAEYRRFVGELLGPAGQAPTQVTCPLQAWRARLAAAGHRAAAVEPPAARPTAGPGAGAAGAAGDSSREALGLFDGLLPQGAEVVFLAQVGSFMYDLHVATSDRDYRAIFLSAPEDLLSLRPPRGEFSRHVNRGFGADKAGDVEYSGQELGVFVGELAKANPRNVELLFSEKPFVSSWVWEELRAARACCLTLRCARQYLGLTSDRLRRIAAVLDDAEAFTDARAGEVSKLLYHAYHKMLDLRRVLRGEWPKVALTGEERERVMRMRMQRPRDKEEARALLHEAERERKELSDELQAATLEKRLPAEVDAEALNAWLRTVRTRCAVKAELAQQAPGQPQLPPPPELARRHSEDDAAIRSLLVEVEGMEGVRIVVAGYGISSRTLGTEHGASDHDVKCIFVHQQQHYFGLKPLNKSFQHRFPSAAGGADVEVSGWEAKHALQMLADNNPSVLGLLLTSRVFAGEAWAARLLSTAEATFDRRMLMVHWYHHGQRNFKQYIVDAEAPLRKRYVHVLRPLLSLAWQRRQDANARTWPPARFGDLLAAAAAAGAITPEEAPPAEALLLAPEDLPRPLPRDARLDALIKRLLAEEQPPAESDWPQARRGQSGGLWNELCIRLIREQAPVPPEAGGL